MTYARGHIGIVKIVDYGHSRTLPSQTAKLNPGVLTANDRGTEIYRAPETIASRGRSAEYSTKVDIYATGVILWEMWTRQLPFAALQKTLKARVEQLVADGHRPHIPDDCPAGSVRLSAISWHQFSNFKTNLWQFHSIYSYLLSVIAQQSHSTLSAVS